MVAPLPTQFCPCSIHQSLQQNSTLQAARDELAARLLNEQRHALDLEEDLASLEGQRAGEGDGRAEGRVTAQSPAAVAPSEIVGLQERVAALKAGRDRLISALDTQAAEVERLQSLNAALAEVGGRWGCQGLAR